MPQDSESEPKESAELAAAAKRILDASKADPISAKIIKLAEELEAAIAKRRKQAAKPG
jgi:hypothetical protein